MSDHKVTLNEKVEDWLRGSGYPLEMAVAALVQKSGFTAFQSEYFFDREVEEMREIDVVGVLEVEAGGGEFRISVAIECKTTPKKPWVVLSTKARTEGPDHVTDRAASRAGEAMLTRISNRVDVQQLPVFRPPARAGYSVVRALGDGPDVPYEAMTKAAKAADQIAYEASRSSSVIAAEIVLPIVVVDGALFEYYLNEDGNAILAQIERGTVYWRNPVAGKIHSVITISTLSGLTALLAEVQQTFEALHVRCGSELAQAIGDTSARVPGRALA